MRPGGAPHLVASGAMLGCDTMLSAVLRGLRPMRPLEDLKEANLPVTDCFRLGSLARGAARPGGGGGGAMLLVLMVARERSAAAAGPPAAIGEVGTLPVAPAAMGLDGCVGGAGCGTEGAARVGMTGRAVMVSRRNGSSSSVARVVPADVSSPLSCIPRVSRSSWMAACGGETAGQSESP